MKPKNLICLLLVIGLFVSFEVQEVQAKGIFDRMGGMFTRITSGFQAQVSKILALPTPIPTPTPTKTPTPTLPVIPAEKYCEKDSDCACGVHIMTGNCFYGNVDYVNTALQCPDFCAGIAGNLKIGCVSHECKQIASTTTSALSDVKVSVVYERLNDARPKRTTDEQLQIFKESYTDLIFRVSWRWNPQPNSCSDVPPAQKQACIDSGYSFEDMKSTISSIKGQNPNIIIIGAIPAQKINKNEVNEVTGETFTQAQTWAMALDPAKWGITSPTKDELQTQLGAFSVDGYYPDITNPKVQELMLSWAKRQIDSGMDGIWIDLLYTQATKLQEITQGVNHPAVKESYDAASKLVDDIHDYGESKGKTIYVGSWTTPMYYPYSPPKLDFVTETMGPKEMLDKKYDETKWKNTAAKVKEKFGDIPLFVFLDWGFRNSLIEIFSQQLSQADAQAFLGVSDDFFTPLGMKFVYPLHGGNMVLQPTSATKLAYGTLNWYDSLAPEFQTYDKIKELAQNKAGGATPTATRTPTPTPTTMTATATPTTLTCPALVPCAPPLLTRLKGYDGRGCPIYECVPAPTPTPAPGPTPTPAPSPYCGDGICNGLETVSTCCGDCGPPARTYNSCCTRTYTCSDGGSSYYPIDTPENGRCASWEYCRSDCVCVSNACSSYLTGIGCGANPLCGWCSYEAKCKTTSETCATPTPSPTATPVPTTTPAPLVDHASALGTLGVPSTMCKGEKKYVLVAMKNDGTSTWTSSYSLAPTTLYDWGMSSVPAGGQTAPGSRKLFLFKITAPPVVATAVGFQWKMKDASGNFFEGPNPAASQASISVAACTPTSTPVVPASCGDTNTGVWPSDCNAVCSSAGKTCTGMSSCDLPNGGGCVPAYPCDSLCGTPGDVIGCKCT